jgi:DNA-binding response OmpR family regulator
MDSSTKSQSVHFHMAVHPDNAGPFFYVLREAVRILFVDDDPILREFAVVNLASEHAVVDTAQDGRAALAAIAANTPDIVLLDLEMPVLDGFGVLTALRADPRWRDLPVIVVTGREDVDAVDRAFGAGATSFVVKPLNWRLLSHQLRYVHRMSTNERLLAERAETTATQLMKLAAHGAHFISQALARDPSLRPTAVRFAQAADSALKRPEAAKPADEAKETPLPVPTAETARQTRGFRHETPDDDFFNDPDDVVRAA